MAKKKPHMNVSVLRTHGSQGRTPGGAAGLVDSGSAVPRRRSLQQWRPVTAAEGSSATSGDGYDRWFSYDCDRTALTQQLTMDVGWIVAGFRDIYSAWVRVAFGEWP